MQTLGVLQSAHQEPLIPCTGQKTGDEGIGTCGKEDAIVVFVSGLIGGNGALGAYFNHRFGNDVQLQLLGDVL